MNPAPEIKEESAPAGDTSQKGITPGTVEKSGDDFFENLNKYI